MSGWRDGGMIWYVRGTLLRVLTTGLASFFGGVLVSLGSTSSCFFTLAVGVAAALSMMNVVARTERCP